MDDYGRSVVSEKIDLFVLALERAQPHVFNAMHKTVDSKQPIAHGYWVVYGPGDNELVACLACDGILSHNDWWRSEVQDTFYDPDMGMPHASSSSAEKLITAFYDKFITSPVQTTDYDLITETASTYDILIDVIGDYMGLVHEYTGKEIIYTNDPRRVMLRYIFADVAHNRALRDDA